MKKTISAKRWLTTFFISLLALVTLLCALSFAVDPLFRFRVGNGKYHLKEGFSHVGLVKNAKYDTIILGSSMTQNFSTEMFSSVLDCKALLVGIGGVGLDEIISYIEYAQKLGKVKHFYICADQYLFTTPKQSVTPEYLFSDSILSDLRYLLSYETYFRFLPVSLVLTVADRLGITFPDEVAKKADVNSFTSWDNNFTFSEETVIENYLSGDYKTSSVNKNGIEERVKDSIDRLFEIVDTSKSDFTFFFPPYSALWWCDAERDGLIDTYIMAKEYFFEKAAVLGIEVYDFQTEDFTLDLDNYKDTTHYSKEINNYMTECFKNKTMLLTKENLESNRQELEANVNAFKASHPELFK